MLIGLANEILDRGRCSQCRAYFIGRDKSIIVDVELGDFLHILRLEDVLPRGRLSLRVIDVVEVRTALLRVVVSAWVEYGLPHVEARPWTKGEAVRVEWGITFAGPRA